MREITWFLIGFASFLEEIAIYICSLNAYLCIRLAALGNLKTSFHCARLHNLCIITHKIINYE